LEARWGRLIVHAFRTGQLDFTPYHRDDPYWSLREELVLSDLENEFRARVDELTMMWHSCAGQPSGWEEDNKRVDWHQKEARKTWNDVGRCLLPWYDQFDQLEERPLEEIYAEFKAREKDPAYAEYLRKERQRLRASFQKAKRGQAALVEVAEGLRTLRKRRGARRR